MNNDIITRAEAAEILGVALQRISVLKKSGKIQATPEGIVKSSVLAYKNAPKDKGGRPTREMQVAKKRAIDTKLQCHKGDVTLAAVWEHLPASCTTLPRNQIADILNACNNAFWAGRQAELKDINEYLGFNFWENAEKIVLTTDKD